MYDITYMFCGFSLHMYKKTICFYLLLAN